MLLEVQGFSRDDASFFDDVQYFHFRYFREFVLISFKRRAEYRIQSHPTINKEYTPCNIGCLI
jgi:hypothetical protein